MKCSYPIPGLSFLFLKVKVHKFKRHSFQDKSTNFIGQPLHRKNSLGLACVRGMQNSFPSFTLSEKLFSELALLTKKWNLSDISVTFKGFPKRGTVLVSSTQTTVQSQPMDIRSNTGCWDGNRDDKVRALVAEGFPRLEHTDLAVS